MHHTRPPKIIEVEHDPMDKEGIVFEVAIFHWTEEKIHKRR